MELAAGVAAGALGEGFVVGFVVALGVALDVVLGVAFEVALGVVLGAGVGVGSGVGDCMGVAVGVGDEGVESGTRYGIICCLSSSASGSAAEDTNVSILCIVSAGSELRPKPIIPDNIIRADAPMIKYFFIDISFLKLPARNYSGKRIPTCFLCSKLNKTLFISPKLY